MNIFIVIKLDKLSKVLGIIPARYGSKGLPGKNIKMLCGKPLIAWTIESALSANLLNNVVVSTDSEEIAEISKNFGARVPFIRPDSLARDDSSSISVVKHCVEFLRNKDDETYDLIALLEPTSPLRLINDIDKMINIIKDDYKNIDAVVSIGNVQTHPAYMKRIDAQGIISPIIKNIKIAGRRQDEFSVYFPYGVCYLVKTDVLFKENTFYPKRTFGYKITDLQCIEIDDLLGFITVESILKQELLNPINNLD